MSGRIYNTSALAIAAQAPEETRAAVATKFADCARAFGAEAGSNGWASCSDVPADALAACLDPIIVTLAAKEASVPRIFNQVRHMVERTQLPACFPFMPCELFDTCSPVRGLIVERIRQVVKDAQNHPHAQELQTAIR